MTTPAEIRSWLRAGKEQGATHVIVACDTFSNEDYPVFVMSNENVRKEHDKLVNEKQMTRVMEVYALHLDLDVQLKEHRAFHFEYPVSFKPGVTVVDPDSPLLGQAAQAKRVEHAGSVGPSTSVEPSSPSPLRRPGEVQTEGTAGRDRPISDLASRFFVEVGVLLRLNRPMVERFRELSQAHYDGLCRSLSEHGGFIYGWMVATQPFPDRLDSNWSTLVPVTSRQLDLLCKLLEGETWLTTYTVENALARRFIDLRDALNAERSRLNHLATSPAEIKL